MRSLIEKIINYKSNLIKSLNLSSEQAKNLRVCWKKISKTLFRLDFDLVVNAEMVNLESFKIWQHFFLWVRLGHPVGPGQTCPVDQLVYLTEPSTWVFSFKCSLAHFKAKKVKFSPILPELLTGSNCWYKTKATKDYKKLSQPKLSLSEFVRSMKICISV